MIIKKVAFGNKEEAYIEDRLTDGMNIIFSNENNKGKTLLMQGMMYSIGYESIFPAGFPYREYYFYSEVEIFEKDFIFLRKNNSIAVKHDSEFNLFNSISDFKYFFNSNIMELPEIEKDGLSILADLSLLYEMFFLGQDKRNPSDLISKGRNNKKDFKTMLFSMAGIKDTNIDPLEIKNLKETKKRLEIKIKSLRKKLTLIKENPDIAEFASKSYNQERFQQKQKIILELQNKISDFDRERRREFNRKIKLETLITELRSLNNKIDIGNVKCADCGSDKIIFTNKEFEFEISNSTVRNNILLSINNSIRQKEDRINELNYLIEEEQDRLNKELENTPTETEEFFAYKQLIANNINTDNEIKSLQDRISEIDNELKTNTSQNNDSKDRKIELMSNIMDMMNKTYKSIDKNGALVFQDIFSKNDQPFSGSEEQEFYFSKLIALNSVMQHKFPIIVDSFRNGEISSKKEDDMLKIYITLNKQVILTSTLKDEEYLAEKYYAMKNTNVIDFSTYQDNHILQEKDSNNFQELVEDFEGIIL